MMNFKRLSLTVLLTGLIAGCAMPRMPPPVVINSGAAPTQSAQQSGVELLLSQARAASPIQAAQLKLQAAEILVSQGDAAGAARLLSDIDTRNLPPSLQFDIIRIQTQQALADNNPQQALSYLAYMPSINSLPADDVLTSEQLYADAYIQSGNPFEAARVLIDSANSAQQPEQRQALHNQIWKALSQISNEDLRTALIQPNNNYTQQGWLELALASRSIADLKTQTNNIENWLNLWEAHPAAQLMPYDLIAVKNAELIEAARIGILLPSSGPLASAAAAIQEGIMTAHYAAQGSGNAPQLEFIDSSQLHSAEEIVQVANAKGLQLILGPLDKQQVTQLSLYPSLPIPFLALNYIDQSAANLFQYGLSPEDEARDAATQAFNQGKRRALIFVTNSDWGARAEQAFSDTFTSLGGTVIARTSIDQNSLNANIASILKANESSERAKQLKRVTGLNFEFEERRRQDADCILLAVRPQEGRLIKPTLAFYYASNIPVYATSQIYSGSPNSIADTDLNGIMFGDIPWVLSPPSSSRTALEQAKSDTGTRFGRLYAMGIDAYLLHPYLQQLGGAQGARIDGETGQLSIDSNNKVQRHLQWAVFKNGVPQLTE
jgi:hypothetical protein